MKKIILSICLSSLLLIACGNSASSESRDISPFAENEPRPETSNAGGQLESPDFMNN